MAQQRVEELRFDPGPACVPGCPQADGYCDLSCMFDPAPLLWEGDNT